MEPVTVTITDRLELAGYQRARCHRLSADISSRALDLIVERADSESVPQLLAHFERPGPRWVVFGASAWRGILRNDARQASLPGGGARG